MISGLLLGMVLSVYVCWLHNIVTLPYWLVCWLHNIVTLPYWLVSIDFGTCSYQCSFSNVTLISVHMLKFSWARTLSYLFMYCSVASIGHAGVMLSIVSVSVCSIFVAWYFVCNACCCAATILLSVSAFSSPLDSQRKVSYSITSCLAVLLMYWPCSVLPSHFSFKDFPNLVFVRFIPSFLCHFSRLIDLVLL